jgi:pilus assembly protein Flp/PilA
VRKALKALIGNDEGATLIEYGLLLALIAIVALVALDSLGANLGSIFRAAVPKGSTAAV